MSLVDKIWHFVDNNQKNSFLLNKCCVDTFRYSASITWHFLVCGRTWVSGDCLWCPGVNHSQLPSLIQELRTWAFTYDPSTENNRLFKERRKKSANTVDGQMDGWQWVNFWRWLNGTRADGPVLQSRINKSGMALSFPVRLEPTIRSPAQQEDEAR